jgi:hypothetical protein
MCPVGSKKAVLGDMAFKILSLHLFITNFNRPQCISFEFHES